jgi:uncharacterized MAPEG superfamily protein
MNPTLFALTGFLAWSLLLLVLMETIRSKLVLTKSVAANGFTPDNANLSPFMQRLARAHANCIEGLPIFGGLMLVAAVAGKTAITDPLAYLFLFARVVQSLIHLKLTPFRGHLIVQQEGVQDVQYQAAVCGAISPTDGRTGASRSICQ